MPPPSDSAMNLHEKISAARKILDLPEQATIREIKASYRKLVRKWHPDKCKDTREKCLEMTARLNAAYKTIMDYCEQYRYSFAEDEVHKYLPSDEWWMDRFGNDPIWNKNK